MIDVVAFEERYLGSLLDFSVKAAPGFFYSWAGSEELFRWKHARQPVQLPGTVVPIWLAVSAGRVVGTRGSMIGRYWFSGRELLGAIGCDYYIEPEYRGTGVGKELLRCSVELAPLRLNLNSSRASHIRHLSMGFQEIKGCNTHLSIRNLSSAGRWLHRRLLRGPGGRGTPNPIDRTRDWLAGQPGIEVLTEGMRATVETFLGQVQRRHVVAGLRTMDELLWRYREHPQRHGEVFAWHDNGQLEGVFAVANQSRDGLHILVLADLYLRQTALEPLSRIWRLTRQASRASRADAASVFGSSKQLNGVVHRSLLTYTRRHLCSMQLEGQPDAVEIPSCYISAGDGDYIC